MSIINNTQLANRRQSFDDRLFELRSKSDQELKELLGAAIRVTIEQLVEIALVVRVLEERSVDLGDIKLGLLFYARRIGYMQLLPELVIQFQGYPSILRRVASFAIPDQLRLLSNKDIGVAVMAKDGIPTHRQWPVLELSPDQAKQVFAHDHIRSDEEQIAWLNRAEQRNRRRRPREVVSLNIRKRGIDVAVGGERAFIALADLHKYVQGIESAAGRLKPNPTSMTERA